MAYGRVRTSRRYRIVRPRRIYGRIRRISRYAQRAANVIVPGSGHAIGYLSRQPRLRRAISNRARISSSLAFRR